MAEQSSRTSTPVRTMTRQPSQPASRDSTLSVAMRPRKSANECQIRLEWRSPTAISSTISFMPYCAATAQQVAPETSSARPPNWTHRRRT